VDILAFEKGSEKALGIHCRGEEVPSKDALVVVRSFLLAKGE